MRLGRILVLAMWVLLPFGNGIWPAMAADCTPSEFGVVRGHCADAYLRDDIASELVYEARKAALAKYFPLEIESGKGVIVQIRHHEEISRNRRLRGELLITIRKSGDNLSAEMLSRSDMIEFELQEKVYGHQRKIAKAFAESDLDPQSPEWVARVRQILPTVDALVRDLVPPKQFATTSAICPILDSLVTDALATGASPLRPKGERMISLYLHGRTFEVFVKDSSGNALYVRAQGRETPLFAWADDAVSKLEKCWKPKESG